MFSFFALCEVVMKTFLWQMFALVTYPIGIWVVLGLNVIYALMAYFTGSEQNSQLDAEMCFHEVLFFLRSVDDFVYEDMHYEFQPFLNRKFLYQFLQFTALIVLSLIYYDETASVTNGRYFQLTFVIGIVCFAILTTYLIIR